jgi:hypothetical protein
MDKQKFETGFDPETYVANLRNYRSLVKKLVGSASADQSHVEDFRAGLREYAKPVRMTLMTEDWCGDSACNVPILASLCNGAEVPLRIFRGSEHPDLNKRYNDDGVDHIPVVSIWDGEGSEIGRWIECPAAADERKKAWKEAHPEFMELYQKREQDPDAAKRFAKLYREFLEEMASWYKEGLWSETTREIVEIVRPSA